MLQMRGGNMKASFPSQALPCSGSTGLFSVQIVSVWTPRGILAVPAICGEQRHKDKFFSRSCNILIACFVLPKTLL